ncbi:MAG TPA: sensor histidine kinase [Ktedonobacterales bacterium]|nr:sensor histidine kinase [Ktedonobacterales bacterium]
MSVLAPYIARLPARLAAKWPNLRRFSTFEKVIVANSVIILLETAAGFWVTEHNPEPYHYLIDTAFIALAALLGLAVNFALLRAAFRPLMDVLATIRAVERGDLEARVTARESDADIAVLARAFNSMLDRLTGARDEAAARVLRAQEEERQRLALELHDQTGQSLTALTLHSQAIAQRLEGIPGEAAARARQQSERLSELAQRTLAEVQALSRQLRPSVLDDLGLAVALRWLANDAEERLGIEVRVQALGRARLPAEAETALFRIAQEGLTNAVRHGHANTAAILLRRHAGCVTLLVADNGQGFDARTRPRSCSGGQGMEGMRERARLLGGRLVVRSRPGCGTALRVTVPLQAALVGAGAGEYSPRDEARA